MYPFSLLLQRTNSFSSSFSLLFQTCPDGVLTSAAALLVGLIFPLNLLSASQDVLEASRIVQFHRRLPGYNQERQNLRNKMQLSAGRQLKLHSFTPATGVYSTDHIPSGAELFRDRICNSDVIVVATVEAIKAELSANETQVFTDYQMAPIKVLKNAPLKSQTLNEKFFVTQPGGTIHIDGGEIVDSGDSYPSPMFPGKSYLLFLSELSDNESFMLADNLRTYIIDREYIRTVSENTNRDVVNNFLLSFTPDSILPHIKELSQGCPVSPQR